MLSMKIVFRVPTSLSGVFACVNCDTISERTVVVVSVGCSFLLSLFLERKLVQWWFLRVTTICVVNIVIFVII